MTSAVLNMWNSVDYMKYLGFGKKKVHNKHVGLPVVMEMPHLAILMYLKQGK